MCCIYFITSLIFDLFLCYNKMYNKKTVQTVACTVHYKNSMRLAD